MSAGGRYERLDFCVNVWTQKQVKKGTLVIGEKAPEVSRWRVALLVSVGLPWAAAAPQGSPEARQRSIS